MFWLIFVPGFKTPEVPNLWHKAPARLCIRFSVHLFEHIFLSLLFVGYFSCFSVTTTMLLTSTRPHNSHYSVLTELGVVHKHSCWKEQSRVWRGWPEATATWWGRSIGHWVPQGEAQEGVDQQLLRLAKGEQIQPRVFDQKVTCEVEGLVPGRVRCDWARNLLLGQQQQVGQEAAHPH